MRKILPTFFILLLVCSSAFSQDGLIQFTKSYFHPHPFAGEFSSFVQTLLKDTSIHDRQLRQRTDSSLFYFAGYYNRYNRFFFKPTRVDIILEEASVQYSATPTADTILVYRLMAYTDSTANGEREVKKEFTKIHRQFHRKFDENKYQDIRSGETIAGGVHHYFVNPARLAPVTVAWGKAETHEYALSIIVRMKTSYNRAVLPITLDHP